MSGDGPVADGASPKLLAELLGTLEDEPRAHGVPVGDILLPGIPSSQTIDELQAVGLTAPEELVVWWGWHGGNRVDAASRLVFGIALPAFVQGSVHTAVENYRFQMCALGGADLDPFRPDPEHEREYREQGGGTGWLPLEATGHGTLIDCNLASDGPPKIHSSDVQFSFADSAAYFRAVSLTTIVTWWLDEIFRGHWVWNPGRLGWDETQESTSPSRQQVLFAY
jgi:hypothetical protein